MKDIISVQVFFCIQMYLLPWLREVKMHDFLVVESCSMETDHSAQLTHANYWAPFCINSITLYLVHSDLSESDSSAHLTTCQQFSFDHSPRQCIPGTYHFLSAKCPIHIPTETLPHLSEISVLEFHLPLPMGQGFLQSMLSTSLIILHTSVIFPT